MKQKWGWRCRAFVMLGCSAVNKKDTISNDFLAEINSYAC